MAKRPDPKLQRDPPPERPLRKDRYQVCLPARREGKTLTLGEFMADNPDAEATKLNHQTGEFESRTPKTGLSEVYWRRLNSAYED